MKKAEDAAVAGAASRDNLDPLSATADVAAIQRLLANDPALAARWCAPWVRATLEHFGSATLDWVDVVKHLREAGCPGVLRQRVAKLVLRSRHFQRSIGLRPITRQSFAAPPVWSNIRSEFRSTYERRLAASLDRLGIRYEYESARFDWVDAKGHPHVYTPDFTLSDLHLTFVEVKGKRASGVSKVKHRRVLAQHAITLLLWDAAVIDMVEAMQHPSEVMGLLAATKVAA